METKNIAAQEPMIGEGVGFERIRRITGYLVAVSYTHLTLPTILRV